MCWITIGLLGCKKENQLVWDEEQYCLDYGGNHACVPAKAGGARLLLHDGKPVLQALATKDLQGHVTYPQYEAASTIAGAKLQVLIENNQLILAAGNQRFVDALGLGLLIVPDAKGAMQVLVPKDAEPTPHAYFVATNGTDHSPSRKVRDIQFLKTSATENLMSLTYIEFLIGNENRVIPNDTGTEAIIIDNFKVAGNCTAPTPTGCCVASEPLDPTLDYTQWIGDYADQGKRLLACFPVGSVCTFNSGCMLIVVVCSTNERYCLDLSTCSVTITTTEEQGICFSVPLGCTIENPFN